MQLLPIKNQASPYWDSLACIYHASFPIDEQRPVESIVRLLTEEPRYTMYAIINEDTKPYTLNPKQALGLLTTWHFEAFTYIEHFAIAPEERSQGYGSKALSTFIKTQEKPIVLEAEPPTDDLARRRIRFYQRHGLTLYDYPYLQPAYTPESRPVELRLMGTLDTHVTPLAHVAATLHREVYQVEE